MPESYMVFFDLDRTIISRNSGSIIVRQAYQKGLMSTGNLIQAIFQSYLYKLNLRETKLIIKKMGMWLKGLHYNVIEELSREVVEKYLIKYIRPEIIKTISFHRENNARLGILSSAISTICIPVGRYLGINEIICTEIEAIKGIMTGNPAGNFCFGDEKRIRLLSFCEKNNMDPAQVWYYSDSASDLPVFEVVGHPVCISPDKKLRKIAREKGWEIYDWL
jgi:HAD superfamily hydrolase (TIGR01490 family)